MVYLIHDFTEKADFLLRVGQARYSFVLNTPSTNPFLRIRASNKDQMADALYTHLEKKRNDGEDISPYAKNLAGFMMNDVFSSKKLHQQAALQRVILYELSHVTDHPLRFGTRDKRIGMLDMLVCASDYIANKRLGIKPQTIDTYKEWGENIVTDTDNSLYKPNTPQTQYDAAAHYLPGLKKINFGYYQHNDHARNAVNSQRFAAHEAFHLIFDVSRSHHRLTERDLHFSVSHKKCKKLFDDNRDTFGTAESKAAAHIVYYAQTEEFLARNAEQAPYVFKRDFPYDIADDVLKTYSDELAEIPAFDSLRAIIEQERGFRAKSIRERDELTNLYEPKAKMPHALERFTPAM